MTRLGHASFTTTMDRYGPLFPNAEAALADALDATYDAGNVIPLDREKQRPAASRAERVRQPASTSLNCPRGQVSLSLT